MVMTHVWLLVLIIVRVCRIVKAVRITLK